MQTSPILLQKKYIRIFSSLLTINISLDETLGYFINHSHMS